MNIDRRNLVVRGVPAALVTGLAGWASARPAYAGSASGDSAECSLHQITKYEDLERAFDDLGATSDAEIARIARQAPSGSLATARVGLPGPAAIISCVLTGLYIFRNGVDEGNVIGQLTDLVVGCVGIPGASFLAPQIAKLIWKYRTKIAAALSAAGLTAAQIAPLKNAPEP